MFSKFPEAINEIRFAKFFLSTNYLGANSELAVFAVFHCIRSVQIIKAN